MERLRKRATPLTAATLRRELRSRASPVRARGLARFFKTGPGEYGEGDRFLGLTVPVIRDIVRRHRGLPLDQALALLRSPWHEERAAALLFLVDGFRRGSERERLAIYRAYLANTRYINNWDLVDISAEHVVGGHLFSRSKAPLWRLARSRSLWERRIAVVATFHFIRRGRFRETLRLGRLLLADEEDLIHKAVGWMLREVGKRDPAAADAHLRRHYRKMPRVMLRYAIERLPEARRKAFLTGQIH